MSHGAALPHLRLADLDRSQMILVRARHGVRIEEDQADPICALFFLVSPDDDPGRHLRILAQLASRIDQEGFMPEWLSAETEQKMKEALIHDDRMFVLKLAEGLPGGDLIGLPLKELSLPGGTLVAMIRRSGKLIIPSGGTSLAVGDRLTVIGRPEGISALRNTYEETGGDDEVNSNAAN